MDAITLLKDDHQTVKRLFRELKPLTEAAVKSRTELFERLQRELEMHAHIEEKIFYPVLRKESETHSITLEGVEEHHVIKMLLRELAEMDVATEKWAAKLNVLRENVEHHIEEEEDDMFPGARDVLDHARIVELGDQMQEEKRRYKSGV